MSEREIYGSLIQKNSGKIGFTVGLGIGILGTAVAVKFGHKIPELLGKRLGREVSEQLQNSNYRGTDLKNLYTMVDDLSKKYDDLLKRLGKNE